MSMRDMFMAAAMARIHGSGSAGGSGSTQNAINPVAKTDAMTIPVGVDEYGQLWVAPIGSSDSEDTGIAVESVALDQTEITVGTGSTVQLTATVLPEDATDQALEWYSSNEGIATVDDTGLVTGVAEGSCTIMASAASGAYAEVAVTVEVAAAETLAYEWDYTMGMPEDNGFTVKKIDNATAEITDDGLLVKAGEQYSLAYFASLPTWDGGKIIVECEYLVKKTWYEGTNYGTQICASDGGNGAMVYGKTNEIVLATGTDAKAIATWGTPEDYDYSATTALVRIEYDVSTGLKAYFNGELLGETATLSSVASIGFGHVGNGSTLFKAFRVWTGYSEEASA